METQWNQFLSCAQRNQIPLHPSACGRNCFGNFGHISGSRHSVALLVIGLVGVIGLTGCGSGSVGSPEAPAVTLAITSPVEPTVDKASTVTPPSATSSEDATPQPLVRQLLQKATQAVSAGKPLQAIESLSQAIGIAPQDAGLFRMRADVYSLMGEFANARADFSIAISLAPSNAELHHVRGYFLMTRGLTDDALRDFTRAVELNPGMAVAWNNRGLIHLARQDFAAAEAEFAEAVALDSGYVDAINNRGFARMKQNQLDSALADFREAIQIKPDYTAAWNNSGLVNLQKNDLPAALESFNEAVRLAPMDARWLGHRRAVLQKLGRFAEATADGHRIQWLNELEELTQNAVNHTQDDAVWIARAHHLSAGAEYAAAIEDYTRAIQLEPASQEALHGRAAACLQMTHYQQAVADCENSLRIQQTKEAYSMRGEAWFALGNPDQAIQDFENAQRFDQIVVDAYRQRAQQHQAQGRTEAAKADQEKADQMMAALSATTSVPQPTTDPLPFPEP